MQKPLLHNQSFIDLTLQHCGNPEQLIEFAILNNVSCTDTNTPFNTLFEIPTDGVDFDIVNFFANKRYVPALSIGTTDANFTEDPGIGHMIISTTFVLR